MAAVLIAAAGCYRVPPPETARPASGDPRPAATPDPAPAAAPAEAPATAEGEPRTDAQPPAVQETAETRELLALGPTYTPYDQPPAIAWDTEAEAVLSRKLLPVLREEGMPARTQARLWLLVRADGSVADAVVQTSSGNARFDAAAGEVARQLRFRPAIRARRAVPVWVLQEVSLVMQ